MMTFSFPCNTFLLSFWSRIVTAAGLMLLLHACSPLPTTPSTDNNINTYKQRLPLLNSISEWQVQGKISVTKEGKNTSGILQWWHHPDTYRLDMKDPFGQKVLTVNGNQSQAIAIVDGDIIVANDVNTLFDKKLGWPLPITDIEYWILGIINTNTAEEITINAQGHVISFIKDSWHINLANYTPNTSLLQGQQVWLPSKITLTRQDLLLKAVIKQWQPLPTVW